MTLRVLPPAGVPITAGDLVAGVAAAVRGEAALEDFRKEIRRSFGVRHVILASSGRAALSMLLQGLRALAPDRNTVALPAYTSYSVPSAAVHAGLNVVLYDVDPITLSPDPDSLAKVVDRRTLAVVVCHLYGYLADLDQVRQITSTHGIAIIDDAAQAMDADFRGQPAGTTGDAGLYSLSRGKNINAVDGGVIVTSRDDLAAAIQGIAFPNQAEGTPGLLLKALILSLVLSPSLYWLPRSLPFLNIGVSVFNPDFACAALTPFQAGIARRMLNRLPKLTLTRRASARCYHDYLSSSPVVTLPDPVQGTTPVFLRFPLLLAGTEPVREVPELGVVRSYPAPLANIRELKPHLVNNSEQFPGADRLAARLVTLPTHQFVTRNDVEKIAGLFLSDQGRQ